jgi:sarcosine oxidase/L-pipecolate oxidase
VAGGSFHGFKFLPVMGDIVVQMLNGELDEEMRVRFAWDRPGEGDNSPQFAPRRDLGELW